jgi:hypothetical protein
MEVLTLLSAPLVVILLAAVIAAVVRGAEARAP